MPTIQVPPDEDTMTREDNPTTNYNTIDELTIINVGLALNGKIAFGRLNLAALIPPGSTITSCKLFLYVKGGNDAVKNMEVYDCPRPTAVFSEITWNEYKAGSAWSTPGGDSGTLRATVPMPAPPSWVEVDLTGYAQEMLDLGQPMFFIQKYTWSLEYKQWYSIEGPVPSFRPYFEITYSEPPNLSCLGRFILGDVQLGASLGSIIHSDSIRATDTDAWEIFTFYEESIEALDREAVEMIASLSEGIELLQEFLWYPVLDQVGVQVRITQPIDITWEDFCTWVYEAGHSILLNGDNARAFVNVQQREQSFRGNVKVFPGDAVMFSCPTLAIQIGDTIVHDFREYEITEIHTKLIGGNYIYFKSALKLKDPLTMPKVTGVIVSENLDGQVTLTWDDISRTIYPTMDHYEVWRSPLHPITSVDQVNKEFTLSGEWSEFFNEGDEIDITGSTGNDGTYTIVEAEQLSGITTITVEEAIPSAVADGLINELTFRLAGTTKSPSFTDKGLVAGAFYYYLARAIDKYGNAGEFSELAYTQGDDTSPPKPEGFR